MTARTLVRATMLVATITWAIGEALMRRSVRLDQLARAMWTFGAALAVVHVVLAFAIVYGWNHEAAVEATVRQSADRFGLGWRGGIYVNYVFVILWLADMCWWWIAPASHRSRPLSLERVRFIGFTFMFVNGAIVFAAGTGRLVGVISVVIALVGHVTRRNTVRPHTATGVRPHGDQEKTKMAGITRGQP